VVVRWTREEEQILYDNYGKLSRNEIEKLLSNRTWKAIRSCVKKLRIKGNFSITARKYFYNEDYFSVPTIENSYWAGFIAADGCLSESTNSLIITLHEKDRWHLEKLAYLIGYTGSVKLRKNNCGFSPENKSASIFLRSANQLFIDLKTNFNIVPSKSLILKPPENVSFNNACAFIKGYIDGDGYISITNSNGYKYLTFGAIGTYSMLRWINDYCDRIVCPNRRPVGVTKTRNVYRFSITGSRALKILEYLNNIQTSCLQRKWSKIRAYKLLKNIS
jgi:hypothetical protein